MSTFNSDVDNRLAVAVDLANAGEDGTLPGSSGLRPERIFRDHAYLPPGRTREWSALTSLAPRITHLLRMIAAGDHRAAVAEINSWLETSRATPFLEPQGGHWAVHFHVATASFADGWAGGIAAALALSYGAGGTPRIGTCTAEGCGRLFLDRGRNRQRRFCSLQCQNRAKSTAYRRRSTASTHGGPEG